MNKYIDAEKLIAKIRPSYEEAKNKARYAGQTGTSSDCAKWDKAVSIYKSVLHIITSLQQEQSHFADAGKMEQLEMDLKKLGEIARHLIAVKDHEEDMRLSEDEWLLLNRIGYPERFNTRKEDGKESEEVYDYIDLGLPSGTLWATCNVGANKPEEYGDYLTHEKALALSDIEIPTIEEWKELQGNCKWEWTIENGVKGYKVTGSNNNSIFLPAAGYRDGASLDFAGSSGYYWSSSPNKNNLIGAWRVYFIPGDVGGYDGYRYDEFSIRNIKRKAIKEEEK